MTWQPLGILFLRIRFFREKQTNANCHEDDKRDEAILEYKINSVTREISGPASIEPARSIKIESACFNPFRDLKNSIIVNGNMNSKTNGSTCIELPQPVNPSRKSLKSYLIISLSLIHIWRCRRYSLCRSRWSPYH